MAMIYTLQDIRDALKDRKVSVICERTGLSRQAVYNIINGANVSFETYEKLVEYLFPETPEPGRK